MGDADQIYPGWKEKLGYTGESSVQAATFDWQRKAAAAAFLGDSQSGARQVGIQREGGHSYTAMNTLGYVYEKCEAATSELEFLNNVGYLPDGTPMNMAGNATLHPENAGPDLHVPGSALPVAAYLNTVGYLPDGTPMHMAGNMMNHFTGTLPDGTVMEDGKAKA